MNAPNDLTLPPLADMGLLRTQCYIGGAWTGAAAGATFGVDNPADGSVFATVPDCDAADARRAIEAASAALPAWRGLTAKERAKILRRWFELMVAAADDLAMILTTEQGKPLAEARGEVMYGAAFIEWFAEEAKRAYGEVIPGHMPDKRLIVMKQPIGVAAAITPWNFPNAMITRKAGPALAAGCTLVLKPAEQTPLSALAMAELAHRAGVPPGVFNVVTCSAGKAPAVGLELCENPVVRKLSFTGSTEVGRILMRQCAGTIKKLSLELGGNAPFIVFDDADLDAAAEGLMQSKYRNAGQTCVSANRVYVQAGVYEAFAARVRERSAQLKVGRGTDPGVQVGPLIDEQGLAKVREHLDDAVARGARVETGGSSPGGRYFLPTVLTGVPQDARTAREETFGPLMPLIRFERDEEVIALANASEFGLAAYFYARDVNRVFRVAEALESGMVGINTGMISTEVAPFGGVKQSGLGREGSRHGIEDYLEIKYLCLSI